MQSQSMYNILDKNKDGVVSLDEMDQELGMKKGKVSKVYLIIRAAYCCI